MGKLTYQLLSLLLAFLAQILECRQMVFDPNPLANINIHSAHNCSTYISAISEDNKYAFVTTLSQGVFIISLENKLNPSIVNNIMTPAAQFVRIKNGLLYIGDIQEGVVIYDVSNIKTPVLISKWSVNKHISAVTLTKDSLYCFAIGNGIVYVLDISNPKNPTTLDYLGVTSPETYRAKLSADETHLCVSNHVKGIQIYDVRNKDKIVLRVNQNASFLTWDCIFTPDNTSIYVVDVYYGLFYADVQSVFSTAVGSTKTYTLTFVNIYSTPQIQQSIDITSDGLFVLLGLRSIGLVLFEIQNKNYKSPVFVQRLNGDYLSNDTQFSNNDNEMYAFVTNGMSLLVFQQAQINTNKDFPNIFNTYQSSLTVLTGYNFPWQILCLQNSKKVIQTNSVYGINIFDITDNYYPSLISTIPQKNGSFGGIALNTNESILFAGATQDGMEIYDISDPKLAAYKTNYQPLDPTKYANQGIGVTIDKSQKLLLLSNGFYGFGVIDITDPINYVKVAVYVNSGYACSFEKCIITSDFKTIICACREVGLFFFDFTNYNLKLVNLMYVLGSEYMILSSNEKIVFVCNGFQGILIINIENNSSPFIISQQALDGWAQSIVSILDEQYLLVSQIEKGELVIISIVDITNPYIQSKLTLPGESSQSLCLTPDEGQVYFIGNMGMRYMPISTDLIIHTQIQVQQTDSSGNTYYQDLDKDDSLLVGQSIQIFFVPLYISDDVLFNNVYYYRNFEVQSLPGWINFYQQTNSLSITVDKSGAQNTQSNDKSGENILILDCLIKLSASNFITTNINATLSKQIYTNLVNQGYVNKQGFLTSQLDPTIDFYLDFFDDGSFTQSAVGTTDEISLMQQDILKTLVFSKIQYPIRIFIESSLFFNYNTASITTTNIIDSPSLQISILLQIQSHGTFVKKSFEGVLSSFSDDLTSVKLSGQTYYVNQIVSNSIQVANSTADLTAIMIDVILSDSSNYDLSQKVPLSDLSFIQLYKPITVNQKNNLQTQFNKQESGLQVENRFQFSFDLNTFVQSDNLTITYQAFLVQGVELTQITVGNWIEFTDYNLGFSGQKSISSLLSTYKIRIVATDGYSTIYDEFQFEFTQIPFSYVIQLIVQILGPIIGIFGIWKYRAEIYMFLMEKHYLYSNEQAVVGQVYKKQIVLMDEMWGDAVKLWTSFIKYNKDFYRELIEEYKTTQKLDISVIMAQLFSLYSNNQSKFSKINSREFEFVDSRLVRIIKRFCYQILLNNDKRTQEVLQQLKVIGCLKYNKKDWYKHYVTINHLFEIQKNKVVRPNQNQIRQQSLCVFPSDIKQNANAVTQIMIKDIENQDEINERQINGLNKYETNQNDNDNTQQRVLQFTHPIELDSYGSKATLGLVSNHFSTKQNFMLSPTLKSPHSAAKFYDSQIKLNRRKQNQEDCDEEEYGDKEEYDDDEDSDNLNPFPEIIVQQNKIDEVLTSQKSGLNWDQNLLEEILILEASGIQFTSPSRIIPSNGESLHLFPHNLLRIQAFKRDQEGSCCLCLKKFFKANYNPIGLNDNNPLPSWLNCQIVDGIIHIWGTPKSNDEPEILIRIIDQLSFTIYSFHISILDKDGNTLKEKSNRQLLIKKRSENSSAVSTKISKQKQKQNMKAIQNKDQLNDYLKRANSSANKQSLFFKNPSPKEQKAEELEELGDLSNPFSSIKINELPQQNQFDQSQKNKPPLIVSPPVALLQNDKYNNRQVYETRNQQSDFKEISLDVKQTESQTDQIFSQKEDGEDSSVSQSGVFEEKSENDKSRKVVVTTYIKNQS